MISRRGFINATVALFAGFGLDPMGRDSEAAPKLRIPDEGEEHECSWMAWAHSEAIWDDLLPGVRRDQVNLANAISQFEPVVMLATKADVSKLKKLVSRDVEVLEADFDDLWIRDYGPQFLVGTGNSLTSLDLRFNGWGKKQEHSKDRRIAKFIASELDISIKDSLIVMEGGAVEVDGKGTMIATKSCIVNKNRNPGKSLAQIDSALKNQFGLKRIVWLDGVAGKDITDGHTDFYARFLPNGKVLANLETDSNSFDYSVTRKHLEKLMDEFGDGKVLTVSPPSKLPSGVDSESFAAGYINYCVVNGAVLMPKFGDSKADGRAKDVLKDAYPDRDIVQVSINSIASGGGGIHCATLHQPKANS
jgi:agmatine deiminase